MKLESNKVKWGIVMWKSIYQCCKGGANVEYALFLAAMSVLVLSGVVILGDQFRPQLVAWREGAQIDRTLTGSIETEDRHRNGRIKTYREHKLPAGLKNETDF